MADTQTITLSDIRVTLALGVTVEERRRAQDVLISVALTIGNPNSAVTDDLADTIDYDMIIGFLREALPDQGPLHLIETVADHVATHVLSLSARIETVAVTVKKPSVLPAPAMVSVTLTRHADPEMRRQNIAIADDVS